MFKKLIICVCLFTGLTQLAMEMPQPQTQEPVVKLVSSDNQIAIIPLEVAYQSPTLADILKKFKESETKNIPFTIIDGETLATVVQIMKAFYKHQDLKGKALLDAVEKEVPIYDSQAILLLRAFDFLDFMPGIRLVARYLSNTSSVTESESYGAKTFLKKLIYGAPILDHAVNLIKAEQFTYNTGNEIGRIYYLITNKNLPDMDKARFTFSLQDYLDYRPEIIKERHKSDSLDLDKLQLADLDGLQDIPGINNVTNLELNFNKLTRLPDFSLQGLNNLERLTIIGNELKELSESCLHGLKKLELLSIGGNPQMEIPATAFEGLTNLRILQLVNNQLSELPATLFHGLNNLEILTLYGNQLPYLPAGLFKGLNNLKSLTLSRCQLTELPTTLFHNLNNLKKLDLSGNQLKELPVMQLKELTNLNELVLYGNLLSNEQEEQLRNALPHVKIKFKFF